MHPTIYSMRLFWRLAGLLLGCASWLPAGAQEKSAPITVAQVAPLSGPVGVYARSLHEGMGAYFHWINGQGGIRGSRIELVGVDIPYDLDPALAVEKYTQVARQYRPVAFAYGVSSQVIDALLGAKTLPQLGVPLVGTLPQMYRRRSPVNPFLFFVGGSESREIQRIVEHIATIGRDRIVISYWDDSNNQGLLEVIRAEATRRNLKVVGTHAIAPTGVGDVSAAVEGIAGQNPSALICLMSIQDTARLIAGLRAKGSLAAVYGPSYNDPGLMGPDADKSSLRGVGIAQLVPNPNNPLMPLAQEFRKQFAEYAPKSSFNSFSFQGYIAARLIVQALQRCADPKRPACLRDELEKTRGHDLGGLTANYSPGSHDGLSYVDIGMVSWSGKLVY